MSITNEITSRLINIRRVYLCVDIVNSTRLIREMEAESASELLEKGLQLTSDVIYQHGGTVIYTAGDGLIAEFNPLPTLNNPVLLAILAGLDIQHMNRKTALPYAFRVGIDTVSADQITAGETGYAFSSEVEKNTPPGAVSISESSYCCLKKSIQAKTKAIEVIINDKAAIIYQIDEIPVKTMKILQEKLGALLSPVSVHKEEEIIGEIKLISTIFIKIDETDLSADQIKTYLDNIKEILKDYGATFVKKSGLSVMAVVGAPIAYEDHAARACMIAQRVLKISDTLSIPNQAQVGIHSGQAVVDNIGGEHFHQYDAMGSAVSFAARLQQLAVPGQALISEETRYLAGDAIRVQKLDQQMLKGFKGTQTIYLLENVARTYISQKLKWEFYSQQIFIDHIAEIQMFNEKLDLLSSQAVIWGINAEPGIGKSRLTYEFSKIAAKKGMHILTNSAISYQVNLSFSLLRQFFVYLFNIESFNSSVRIQQMITNGMKRYVKLPSHAISALFAIFGLATSAEWQKLPHKEQLRIIATCMYEILVFHASNKPIFLTLDDMHWCDTQSLSILLDVCARLKKEPIFILMCFRPEFHRTWELFQQPEMTLMPLSIHDRRDLMNHLLHGDSDLEPLKEKIIRQSDGNPFYMEEITRFLVNNHVLVKEGKYYHLLSAEIEYDIPDTIQGVISGSIDRLPPKNKQLLQQSSILGFNFSLSDLHLLSDMRDQELALHLNELQDMGLLYTKELFPHTMYSFKHAYILEVTYQMMRTKNRVRYHEKFVHELEKLPELNRRFDILAYHSFQEKLWLKSFLYYFKIIPPQISIEFPISRILIDSEKAEQAYQQLSTQEQDRYFDNYATVKMQQLHAIMAVGRPDQIFGPFQQLESLAAAKNNHFVQALSIVHLIVVNTLLNNFINLSPQVYESVLDIGARAMEERHDFDKDNFMATLYFSHTIRNYVYADYDLLYINSLPMREKLPVPNTSSIWLGLPIWNLSRLLPMMALLEQMKLTPDNAYLDELVNAVTDQPPSESTVGNQWALGMAYFAWGDLDNSKKHFMLGLEESEKIDMIMFNPVFYSHLAFIAMIQGEHDKACQYAKTAYEISKMLGHMFFGISSMGRIASVLLYYGNLDLTKTLLDECLPIAEKAGQKCRCIELYQAKADYLIEANEQPDAVAIVDLLQKADDLVKITGAIFYYPFIQRSYVHLYKKLAQVERSNTHWRKMSDFYEAHPSEFWRAYFYKEYTASQLKE